MYARVRFGGAYTAAQVASIKRFIKPDEAAALKVKPATGYRAQGRDDLLELESWNNYEICVEDLLHAEIPTFEVVEQVDRPLLRGLFGLMQRLEALESGRLTEPAHTFNQRCNVHVPSLGLLLIDEVRVLENACTDTVQQELEQGWRIVAVCPQPDQRRPDYVMGRTRNNR